MSTKWNLIPIYGTTRVTRTRWVPEAQRAHGRVTKQLMKQRLLNSGSIAVVFLHQIYRAVIEHARRRRGDALRRHTGENGL